VTLHFVGYRHDGSIVTTDFTTDGIIDGTGPLPDFQTFNFDQTFRDLDLVETPSQPWSLDNVVVTIPEPSAATFVAAAAVAASAGTLRRSRQKRWRATAPGNAFSGIT
jgi:hypothetical protein